MEKKHRSIAAISLEQYCDFVKESHPEKIDRMLETIKACLPEDVTMIQDEPLSSDLGPERHDVVLFSFNSYTSYAQICRLRKGVLEAVAYISVGGWLLLDHVMFNDADGFRLRPGSCLACPNVDEPHDDIRTQIGDLFRVLSEKNDSSKTCAKSKC